MPELGLELHDGGTEGVIGGDLNIYVVSAALIRGVRWPIETSPQVCDIISLLDRDIGMLIILDLEEFLGDTTGSVGGHDGYK